MINTKDKKNKIEQQQKRYINFDDSNTDINEMDILDHSDLSFLMNHTLDELEAEYADEETSDETGKKQENTAFVLEDTEEAIVDKAEISEQKAGLPGDEENYQPANQNHLKDEFLGLLSTYEQQSDDVSFQISEEEESAKPLAEKWKGVIGEEKEHREKEVISEEQGKVEFLGEPYHSTFQKKKLRFLHSQATFQIGLDVGSEQVKYVISKRQKGSGQILAFGILPNVYRLNFDELVKELISAIKIKTNFPGIRVSCNVYGANVGIKRNTMPKMNAKMLQNAVNWSAKKEFNLEEVNVLVDFVRVGKAEKKGIEQDDLLTVACEEELINEKIKPILTQKLLPFKITPLAVSLWSFYKKSSIYDAGKVVVLIDMGAKKTTIVFIHNGVLEFTREIPTGGKDITEALTGTIFYHGEPFQFDYQEAETIKLEYGIPGDNLKAKTTQNVPITEYAVLMRPILERLGSEIQRSIDYYRENYLNNTIDQIYLLGGTSQLKNLIDFFSELIEPDIDLMPAPEKINHNLLESDADLFLARFKEFAVAYSLATDYKRKLNLIPPSIQRLETIKAIRRYTIYGVFIGFILMGIFSGFSFLRFTNLKSQYDFLKLEYSRLEPLKNQYDVLQQRQLYLQNKKQVYKNVLILDNSLSLVLKIIANLFPKNMALTNLNVVGPESESNLIISKEQKTTGKQQKPQNRMIQIFGVYYNPKPDAGIRIANYLRELEKTNLFRSIRVANQDFIEEFNQLKFEIVGELNP